jgi:hypothetical protein
MTEKKNDKKDWIILEIVRDFLRSYIEFVALYDKYKARKLQFTDWDQFVNDKEPTLPLYTLKQSCHLLYRQDDQQEVCSHEEKLLDLAVGAIFHESMKIRECLYQLEVYRPRFAQIHRGRASSQEEQNLMLEFARIGARAEKRLAEGMAETNRVFRHSLEQLTKVLHRYRHRHVLIRFLLKNKELLQRTFGKNKGLKVIANLFPGGLGEAYEVAARSYLDSEYYDLAASFFHQALRYQRGNDVLKSLHLYAQGMDGYYKNSYDDTLRAFTKLLPFAPYFKNGNAYLAKVEDVCRKIAREYLDDNRKDSAQTIFRLAEAVNAARAV